MRILLRRYRIKIEKMLVVVVEGGFSSSGIS